MYGLIFSVTVAGPDRTQMSWPASAMAGAPKTGMAAKEAPAFVRSVSILVVVSGWMVLQSTKILDLRSTPEDRKAETVASMAGSSPRQVKMMSASAIAEGMSWATLELEGWDSLSLEERASAREVVRL